MTNRTIQFFGQGYGTVAINANVQINGNAVFTGEIPTVDAAVSVLSQDQVKIFEFELPLDTVGPVPVTILFTGAETVYVEQVISNYASLSANPIYTPEEIAILQDLDVPQSEKLPIYQSVANPPLTSQDIAVLENGTQEEQRLILAQNNISVFISGPDIFSPLTTPQSKNNVEINGVMVTPMSDPPGGEWGWAVPLIDGTGTITFNLALPPT